MIREIQLRAWCEENKEMYYPDETYCFKLYNTSIGYYPHDHSDELQHFSTNPAEYEKEIKVMQYTGLKDYRGQRVYEGDLLRRPAASEWDKENYTAFEVFFHNGDTAGDHIGWVMNRTHYQGSICGGYIPKFLPKNVSEMEVIGNIYQHVELLKSTSRC